MRLYVGDTRSRALLHAIAQRDRDRALLTGQLVQRGRLDAWLSARQRGERTWLWAYDSGAYMDWRAGRPFDELAYAADVARIARLPRRDAPGWMVLPDIVCGGERSLELSLAWLRRLRGLCPLYVALQEGIDPRMVSASDQLAIDGWFVGGASWAWKVRAACAAVAWCHDAERNPAAYDQRVHVGRAGSRSRLIALRQIGVASCDSNGPLWSADAWRLAQAALREPLPRQLWEEAS